MLETRFIFSHFSKDMLVGHWRKGVLLSPVLLLVHTPVFLCLYGLAHSLDHLVGFLVNELRMECQRQQYFCIKHHLHLFLHQDIAGLGTHCSLNFLCSNRLLQLRIIAILKH